MNVGTRVYDKSSLNRSSAKGTRIGEGRERLLTDQQPKWSMVGSEGSSFVRLEMVGGTRLTSAHSRMEVRRVRLRCVRLKISPNGHIPAEFARYPKFSLSQEFAQLEH